MSGKEGQYVRQAVGWSDEQYADARTYLEHRARVVAELGPRLQPGDEVLDLACGDGGFGEHLLRLGLRYRGVDSTPEMAAAAEQRAREATAQANAHRQQAQSEAEGLLSRARREAEQIVASATTQAESVSASGAADAERELAAVQAEVDRMTKRRDAVAAQLGALRDVVAGFSEDES